MGRRFLLAVLLASITTTTAMAQPIPVKKPATDQTAVTEAAATPQQKENEYALSLKHLLQKKRNGALNSYEAALYKEIFSTQSRGDWQKANDLIEKLDNPILIGHVLIQRYFHPDYPTTQDEYKDWQKHFHDHPQSKRVDRILKTSKSAYTSRANGTLEELRYFARGSKYLSEKYSASQRYQVSELRKAVTSYLSSGKVTYALSQFEASPVQEYIDPIDKAQILAEIAAHYLYLDRPRNARTTALKALKASDQAPLAGWVMGLTSWINNDMPLAAKYFRIASQAPYASPWMTSAAAYWSARAYMRAKEFRQVTPMLATAIKYQRTFYGLLATKTKGYGFDFNWTMPELSAKHKDLLLKNPVGARVLALTQIEEWALAEEELFNLPIRDNPDMAEAALAVAHEYNLAGYAMRFSLSTSNPAGGYYDSGMFPISSWTTDDKYPDQALLNAFIRQESRFRINALNPTGATGLMQVMPATAAYITNEDSYKSSQGRLLLSNPKTNVDIGAAYLDHLLHLDVVNHDLFKLAIAYNAGPGKLRRWKKELPTKDPLLFIELIPSSETRAFVERVMTNYWIYQLQMGIEPKTLLDVAEGRWPIAD